ncbi:hypothetical protein ELUMI_v1c03940 [Williamsoniiplasma luminosum]|uniref:Lipoprotein n=1 Tax=Williamsoniiplasma luminosum TaxID=214888 RepID=A0A2K8NTK2_9MOLU|nr:lipoprotein [Williamsoniiplasma luminosum]ATZ17119.1 hypothetical protein ELUMI_v1c03940 [Williamsoniiplasma luminosum]
MKKLLTILGGLGMVATTGLTVVACTNKDEDESTGSKFIDDTGDLNITSETLLNWVRENSIGLNNIAKMKEFFQFFGVAIMNPPADKDKDILKDIVPTKTSNQYALEDLRAQLTKLWGKPGEVDNTTVNGKVEQAWRQKADKSKEDNGEKKYKDVLKKELHKQFPWVKNDYDTLVKAWKNNERLTNSEYSAYGMLTKKLIDGNSKNVIMNQNSPNAIQTEWGKFRSAFGGIKVSDLAAELVKATEDKKNIALNLINMTGGVKPITTGTEKEKTSWSLNNVEWATKDIPAIEGTPGTPANPGTIITQELAKDLKNRLFGTKFADKKVSEITDEDFGQGRGTGVHEHWTYMSSQGRQLNSNSSYFDLVSEYPNLDPSDIKTDSDNEVYGLLTNSQRYLMDTYFKNEKPISVSEVVFKSTNGDLTKNINGPAFLNSTTPDAKNWQQYYGLVNFLENYVLGAESKAGATNDNNKKIEGSSLYKFDTIFANTNPTKKGHIWTNKETTQTILPEEWDAANFEVKAPDTLISMNNPGSSSMQKYAVYDFLASETTKSESLDPTGSKTTIDKIAEKLSTEYEFITTPVLDAIKQSLTNIGDKTTQDEVKQSLFKTLNLIKSLNRRESTTVAREGVQPPTNAEAKKVYQVLNAEQGIIAFIDKDGLHITKINGFELLKQNKITAQKSFGFTVDKKTYMEEVSKLKRLNSLKDEPLGLRRLVFQDYADQIWSNPNPTRDGVTPPDFIDKLVDRKDILKAKDIGVDYASINSAISNQYEKFLVNNSILNGTSDTTKSFYGFNVIAEMKKEMTENDKDANKLSKNNIWLWDYIIKLTGKTHKDLMQAMFKFGDDNISKQTKKDLTQLLKKLDELPTTNSTNAYNTGKQKWDQDIDNVFNAMTNPTDKKNAPKAKLTDGEKTWSTIPSSKLFDPFTTTTTNGSLQATRFNFDNVKNIVLPSQNRKGVN